MAAGNSVNKQNQNEDVILLKCLRDFDAREDDELSFKKEQVLIQLDNSDESRILARHTVERHLEGYVPRKYVLPQNLQEDSSDSEENDMLLECLYDYDARREDELSFKKGQVLVQLGTSNKSRLLARHTVCKFQEGYVPSIYVRTHSLKEEDSCDCEDIPEVLSSDPRTRLLFEKALKEGKEIDNTVRVMVIGCHAQGKTSLVRRLLGQEVLGVLTTDGIDVKQCNVETYSMWKEVEREDIEHDSYIRLAKIARSNELRSSEENERIRITKQSMGEDSDQRPPKTKDELAYTPERTETPKPGLVRNRINEIEKMSLKNLHTVRSANQHKTNQRSQSGYGFSTQKTDLNALKKFKSEFRKTWSTNTDESKIKLSIWDFGGQFIYYATHQIFHSRQSVYLLVFNLAEGLDVKVKDNDFPRKSEAKTMRDYIRFWVNSVHSFVGSDDGKKPVIILVGTFKDKLPHDADMEDCFEEIRKMFDETPAVFHFYRKHFAISNVISNTHELERLRRTIIHVGKKNRQGRIPGKWIFLEEKMKEVRSSKIINLTELLDLDQKNPVPVQNVEQRTKENNDDIKLFLKYYHARGIFCYFDNGELSQYVVLDPQYLIDAFKCIITSHMFCKVRPDMRKYWKELCEEAVLEPVLIDAVWTRKNNEKNYIHYKDVLIQYLKKFRIISEMYRYDEDFKGGRKPLGKYIVPSLLKLSANDRTVESFIKGKHTSDVSFGYMFKFDTVLPTLYQRTLSAMAGQWPLIKYDGTFVVFDNVVACRLQHDHAGVLMLVENRLELLVVNLCPPQDVQSNLCDMFRRFVEMVLGEELPRFREVENAKERRESQYVVRCFNTSHGYSGSKGFLTFSDTDPCKRMPCPDIRSHCVDLPKVKQTWFLQDINHKEIPKRRLTGKEYSYLSTAIGTGWKDIGHMLGIDEILMQHIEMDNMTTASKIYAMFLKWDSTYDENATLDVLIKAISSCSEVDVRWDKLRNLINRFNS